MGSRTVIGVCVLGSVAIASAWLPRIAGAALVGGAADATAATTQAQTGTGTGTAFDYIYLGQENLGGTYTTRGQLGSGRFSIDLDYNDTDCTGSGTQRNLSGTARFQRADGAVLSGTVAGAEPCVAPGAVPVALTVDLTSGTHDLVAAHLGLAGTRTFDHITPSGDSYILTLTLAGSATFTAPIGYWMVDETGSVAAFGGLAHFGDAPTNDVTHLEGTPDHNGYWIVDAAGHVFAFGDAAWLGNAPSSALASGETVTNLSATPSGNGYWLFTSRGRVLPRGDASFFGDMHAVALNGPVIGAVATPTGDGYYMVASDGGVFAFGDAAFHGSMGAAHLNRPVNGLVPTADNHGYWLVASDGGVFAFAALFLGSMGGTRLNRPVVGMTRYGTGYLMVSSDGGLFSFSDQPFFGSRGGTPLAHPVVGVAATA